MERRDRSEVLADLVHLRGSLEVIGSELRRFPWDSEDELVTMTPEDAVAVLGRAISGEIGLKDVEMWADLLEVRDDVGFPPETEDTLREMVFDLANPLLNGAITVAKLGYWIGLLSSIEADEDDPC
jgi:hypothetical protein